ncbi:hypothetical protein FA95DRAFT_1611143 [Auriscalpium vulgare]|uniref:Uncharacterized protein n=1 Tax=Auriscalpium vulgare TaxID=40419 RepID=A0ACB8RC73_9AGAM|nr:hypothetical protein FA95DRAFT_1611143 [Auriscalpium vulgare]
MPPRQSNRTPKPSAKKVAQQESKKDDSDGGTHDGSPIDEDRPVLKRKRWVVRATPYGLISNGFPSSAAPESRHERSPDGSGSEDDHSDESRRRRSQKRRRRQSPSINVPSKEQHANKAEGGRGRARHRQKFVDDEAEESSGDGRDGGDDEHPQKSDTLSSDDGVTGPASRRDPTSTGKTGRSNLKDTTDEPPTSTKRKAARQRSPTPAMSDEDNVKKGAKRKAKDMPTSPSKSSRAKAARHRSPTPMITDDDREHVKSNRSTTSSPSKSGKAKAARHTSPTPPLSDDGKEEKPKLRTTSSPSKSSRAKAARYKSPTPPMTDDDKEDVKSKSRKAKAARHKSPTPQITDEEDDYESPKPVSKSKSKGTPTKSAKGKAVRQRSPDPSSAKKDGRLSATKAHTKRTPTPDFDDDGSFDEPLKPMELTKPSGAGSLRGGTEQVVAMEDVDMSPEDRALLIKEDSMAILLSGKQITPQTRCEITIPSRMDPIMARTFRSGLPPLRQTMTGPDIVTQGFSAMTDKEKYGVVDYEALADLVAFARDGTKLVNASRADPAEYETLLAQRSGSSTIAMRYQTCLFVSFVFSTVSNIITPRVTNNGSTMYKEMRGHPVSMEWERLLGFCGAIFREATFDLFALGGTVGYSSFGDKPEAPQPQGPNKAWLSTSPSSKRYAMPGRTATDLNSMTRKPLSTSDNIPVWDISSQYRGPSPDTIRDAPEDVLTMFSDDANLWKEEIPVDSLVAVFHTISSFRNGQNLQSLSFNIQGALILAMPTAAVPKAAGASVEFVQGSSRRRSTRK